MSRPTAHRTDRRPGRGANACPAGDAAVSEVLGYMLVFVIMGTVILLSALSYGNQREAVEQRVAATHAQAAATRLAQVVYDVGVTAGSSAEVQSYRRTVDLPYTFEGRSYTAALANTASGWRVLVRAGPGAQADAPVANVGVGQPSFELCEGELSGGPVVVRYAFVSQAPVACTDPATHVPCDDVRSVRDALVTAGQTTLVSATAAFVNQPSPAGDLNRALAGPALASGTTIAAVTSATQATLSQPAVASSSSTSPATVFIGVADPLGCFRLFLEPDQ